MAITQYNIYSYISGVNGYGLPFSNAVYGAILAAGTDTTITVPGTAAAGAGAFVYNKFIAVFNYATGTSTLPSVWVAVNATAEVPPSSGFTQITSELNPQAKYVRAGDVIHFLSDVAATDVSIAFFAIQEG